MGNRNLRTLASSLLCCAFVTAAWAEVTIKQWPLPGKTAPPKAWRYIAMKSGAKSFVVRVMGGAVGLGPRTENWYGGGFLFVELDKKKLAKVPAMMELVKGGSDAAEVRVTWNMEAGPVVAGFTFRDGDDKLWMTVKLPKADHRVVRIRCYPSSFAGGWKQGAKIRQRHALTAKQDQKITEKVLFKARLGAEEPWALFMDDHFDVAQKRGVGPCAALIFPEELKSARAIAGDYSADVILTPKRDVEKIHVVLWDFLGVTNADAVKYMKSPDITPAKLAESRP